MTLTLLTSQASPFARMVRVVLLETAQTDIDLVDVTTSPLASDPTLVAANPLGKLPALVRDDGPTIFDSRVICRFLDARAGAGLFPEARTWEVQTLEALGHGVAEATLAMTYEMRFRPDAKQWDEWVDMQWQKVARALDTAEARWMSHLEGPLTMAQTTLGCALAYIDLRHAGRDWRRGRPALAAWEAKFATREAMQASAPPAA